jgi:hypothetical protein
MSVAAAAHHISWYVAAETRADTRESVEIDRSDEDLRLTACY